MKADEPRCEAATFDGTEYRRCTRPASSVRDGIAVCRQHARLARLRFFPVSRS